MCTNLLVGACFLVAQTVWLSVLKPKAAGQAGKGCLVGGKAVFAEVTTDRWMVKISVPLNALIRRSLSIKRCFPFTPGSTMLSAALQMNCAVLVV